MLIKRCLEDPGSPSSVWNGGVYFLYLDHQCADLAVTLFAFVLIFHGEVVDGAL